MANSASPAGADFGETSLHISGVDSPDGMFTRCWYCASLFQVRGRVTTEVFHGVKGDHILERQAEVG